MCSTRRSGVEDNRVCSEPAPKFFASILSIVTRHSKRGDTGKYSKSRERLEYLLRSRISKTISRRLSLSTRGIRSTALLLEIYRRRPSALDRSTAVEACMIGDGYHSIDASLDGVTFTTLGSSAVGRCPLFLLVSDVTSPETTKVPP